MSGIVAPLLRSAVSGLLVPPVHLPRAITLNGYQAC
jgi:hypothetical protein